MPGGEGGGPARRLEGTPGKGERSIDAFLSAPRTPAAIGGVPYDSTPGKDDPGRTASGGEEEIDGRAGDGNEGGEAGDRGKRARRRRTPHQQHLNKLCQRRYRERQKNKMTQMEAIVKRLDERSLLLRQAQHENSALRDMNQRLEVVVKEQQELLTTLNEASKQSGLPPLRVGHQVPHAPETPTTGQRCARGHLGPGAQPIQKAASVQQHPGRLISTWSPTQNEQSLVVEPQKRLFRASSAPGDNRLAKVLPPSHSWPGDNVWTLDSAAVGGDQQSSGLSASGTLIDPATWGRLKPAGHPPPSWSSACGHSRPPPNMYNKPITTGHQLHDDMPLGGAYVEPEGVDGTAITTSAQSPHAMLVDVEGPSVEQRSYGASGLQVHSPKVFLSGCSPTMQSVGMPPASVDAAAMDPMLQRTEQLGLVTAAPENIRIITQELGVRVQSLRNLLEANAIFMGGVQASEELVRVLGNMLSSVAELAVKIVTSRDPATPTFGSFVMPKMPEDLAPDEREAWQKCVTILNLSSRQKATILNLRAEHLHCLPKIYEERAQLNGKARAIMQASCNPLGPASPELRLVWDQIKLNIRQEHQVVVEGLHMLLFSILEPVQAALLVVEAHPVVVEPMKLGSAILSLSVDSTQRSSSSSSLGALSRHRTALDC
ncbi:unnamed protein product [Ostreobium quekettii]|uniref:BZIP domain-containing protein n=1 Tax=Ostreobium quekettii TaxID=121088 RepID=A0A8S1IP59_9CHLO|nr:unnamed protein product [Ostreobium quekettii]